MAMRSHQKHYAICIFSNGQEFYQHGLMLQINGVEHMQDLRHSVVQGNGLFRLGIGGLRFEDGCYTGEVTRLDDVVSAPLPLLQPWSKPSHVITTQSTPTRKVSRPRPCSMRISSSAPNHHYVAASSCPGSVYRKTWAMDFSKKPSSPPPTPTFKKQHTKLPLSQSVEDMYAQFCMMVWKYVSENERWIMQYDWYVQQGNREAMVWWGAHILPLTFEEKMSVLSTDSVRERMVMLITLINK
ncbi:uncharacterized protein EV154DRAFT_591179 [Mucor mucedo]|uniref:uncharacterized protein n=1 Tax=Mucor mucedo TaxID=29922 RepID=UPI00221E43E4|nr:uncharacterized protein EV154DRAFT_591179 [Mucor mucedo]KAI7889907.1 hypothetical protein EV154DRAFT_591179 [Mucor mucedo]